MHRGYDGRVQRLVVDEEHVVVRMPTVPVTPCELECDDVSVDAEAPFEPLPGRSGCDLFPCGPLGLDEVGEPVTRSCGTVIVTRLVA